MNWASFRNKRSLSTCFIILSLSLLVGLALIDLPRKVNGDQVVNSDEVFPAERLNEGRAGSLILSAADPQTAYTSTDRGTVFKSTDGGATWLAASQGLPVPFTRRTYPPLLAVKERPNEVLFAVIGQPVHSGLVENRLYRSVDGARHWRDVKRLPDNWVFDSVWLDEEAPDRLVLESDHGRLVIDGVVAVTDEHPVAEVEREPTQLPWRVGTSRSLAQQSDFDDGNIAVLHDDGTFLQEFDLANRTIQFTPNGFGGYDVATIGSSFETNLGNRVTLSDDGFQQVNLSFFFSFFGVSRNVFFVNANGNITFDSGDGDATPSLTEFISGGPRIAPLWDDFNPAATTGANGVFVRTLGTRVVITWNNVPEFNTTNSSTVQLVLFSNGRIRMSFRSVATKDGLVGISNGHGSSFFRVNFDQDLPASFTSAAPILQFFDRGLDTRAVAQRFYQSHQDSFDFLIVFGSSTFPHSLAGPDNLSITEIVKNDISGIGLSNFDHTSAFGSAGLLQSVVVMNRLSDLPSDVNEQVGRSTFTTLDALGRGVGQRWGAYVRFNDGGIVSDELLGRCLSNWSFFHSTDASFLEGNEWLDQGGNSFRSTEATNHYSPLDQYLMGLRSSAEVPNFSFISNPSNTGGRDRSSPPEIGVTVNGTRRTVSVNQIIQVEGTRVPSSGVAPHTFAQAFVLIVPQGEEASEADLAKLDDIRQAWEPTFASATDNRGSVRTELMAAGPDLAVNGLSAVPTTVTPGGTVSVSFSIVNQGTQNAASTFHEIRLSSDPTIDASDTLLTTVVTPVLFPTQSISFPNLVVTIPSTTSAGTQYLGVIADSSNGVAESNEGNNSASIVLNVGSTLADLTVANLTVNPSSVAPGASTTVSFSIVNQGSGNSDSTTHEVRLSTDTVIDANDTLLTTVGTPTLMPAGQQVFNLPVTIPSGTSLGTIYLGVNADAGGFVTEANEGNNTAATLITITAPQPDLVVNNLAVNPTVTNPGGTVTVSFSILNQGGTTAGSTTHRLVISLDGTITTSDTILSTVGTPSLASGSSAQFSLPVPIPSSTPSGAMFIGVIADVSNGVAESNESNNTASTPITITGAQPDLIITGLVVNPSTVSAGGLVTVSFTVFNQGTGTANGATHEVRLSPDTFIDSGDTFLTLVNTAVLASGGSMPFNVNVTIPPGTPPGGMFIGIRADASGSVAESNEANNTAVTPITIAGAAQADLVVTNLALAPTSADAGETVTVNFTILNQGSAVAAPASHEVRFSTDMTIDASDPLLTTTLTGNLGASASMPFSESVTIPTTALQGTNFIGVIADSGNAVAESVESNNTASAAITITSFNEVEPNNNALLADSITPNVNVIGTIGGAGDVDFFRFSLSSFQTVTIDIDAESLSPSSPLDSVVTLFDTTGLIQLDENDDQNGSTRDSRLTFMAILGGEFVFRVADKNGNGGPTFKYKAKVTIP